MKISPISVSLVDKMGSDLSVVNAARVSFHKVSTELTEADRKLIGYLARHNHWSPFAHCFLSYRIRAPIFVARQLVKHQVGLSWNEVSRRYVDDEPEFYFPNTFRGKPENAKQGSSGPLPQDIVFHALSTLQEVQSKALDSYYYLLDNCGVAPEQARMVLPLNTHTEWIWSGSLYAFARVCNLRIDPHAQEETREVARLIYQGMLEHFPVSTEALVSIN